MVEDMHERKTKMAALADGFIALPGGRGRSRRFSNNGLGAAGIHEKPCAFLNIKGYYDPLQAMVDNMVREGFMHPRYARCCRSLPRQTRLSPVSRLYAAGPKMGSAASYLNIKRRVNSAQTMSSNSSNSKR